MAYRNKKRSGYKPLHVITSSYGANNEFVNTIVGELSTVSLIIILPPTRFILKKSLSDNVFIIVNRASSTFLTVKLFLRASSLIWGYVVNRKVRKKITQLVCKRFNYYKRLTFWAKSRSNTRGYLLDVHCERSFEHFRGSLESDYDRIFKTNNSIKRKKYKIL